MKMTVAPGGPSEIRNSPVTLHLLSVGPGQSQGQEQQEAAQAQADPPGPSLTHWPLLCSCQLGEGPALAGRWADLSGVGRAEGDRPVYRAGGGALRSHGRGERLLLGVTPRMAAARISPVDSF